MSNIHTGTDCNNDPKHRQSDGDCSSKGTGHALTKNSGSKQVNVEYDAQVGPVNYMRRRGVID